jgi:hypothetical protein
MGPRLARHVPELRHRRAGRRDEADPRHQPAGLRLAAGGASPYVFDFATSVAARGEIELRRRAGEALPEGWALDPDGAPTTDPERALAGAMLPFGGHKGPRSRP